jgi:esterase FrsA
MLKLAFFFRIAAALALASLLAGSANAQIAASRTWPELKDAVQQRVDRNAYPLTGMKPDDVREILSNINFLDRDEWAAAWSKMGTRYAEQATQLAATDRKAAHEAYLMAFRYDAFGGGRHRTRPGRKRPTRRALTTSRRPPPCPIRASSR